MPTAYVAGLMRSVAVATVISMLLPAAVALAAPPAVDKITVGDNNTIFPESLTATKDGTVYVGGTGTGRIYRAKPGEDTATAFTKAPTNGPKGVFGVWADKANGNLWACFNGSGKPDQRPPSIIKSFDMSTGKVKNQFPLGENTFCNDMVTARDGTLFVAETTGGKILRLGAGGYELSEFAADPQLAGVDGITLGPDGNLYVNSFTTGKVFRVEVKPDTTVGTITEIQLSQPLNAPDGMRFGTDGKLYVAENKGGQIDQITLDGDKGTVKVLKTGFDTPTGVSPMADGTLWFSEEKAGARRDKKDPGSFYVYWVDPAAAQ